MQWVLIIFGKSKIFKCKNSAGNFFFYRKVIFCLLWVTFSYKENQITQRNKWNGILFNFALYCWTFKAFLALLKQNLSIFCLTFSLLLHQALASLQVTPAKLIFWNLACSLNSDQNLRELILMRRENWVLIENLFAICIKADSYICQVAHNIEKT